MSKKQPFPYDPVPLARKYLFSLEDHPDRDVVRDGLLENFSVFAPVEDQVFGNMLMTTPVRQRLQLTDSDGADVQEIARAEIRLTALSQFEGFFESSEDFSDEEIKWLASLAVATLLVACVWHLAGSPAEFTKRVANMSPNDCLGVACGAAANNCDLGELIERGVDFVTLGNPSHPLTGESPPN